MTKNEKKIVAKPEQQLQGKVTTKNISVATYILSIVLALSIGFVGGGRFEDFRNGNGIGVQGVELSSVQQTYAKLHEKFDGKLSSQKLAEGANRGMVEAAGDPYTVFFNKQEAEEFNKDLDGTFSGVGAQLDKKDSNLIVIAPLKDSPAEKAGLLANDIIGQVNGEDASKWPIEKAVSKIKGKAGTTVKLTVLRGTEVKEFSITRAVITDPSVKTEVRDGVGIITITRFGNDTSALARKAAHDLKDQNVKGIVLDLRGNGGGYVTAAQEVSSLWLAKGATIVTERRGAEVVETQKASGDAVLLGMPTTVLIDGGSASASEIVAGALKDNKAAQLVGVKSFGKGSVQEVVELKNGAQLKVTIAKWYTPSGKNISKQGISPDVAIALTPGSTRENDPQLNKALELIK